MGISCGVLPDPDTTLQDYPMGIASFICAYSIKDSADGFEPLLVQIRLLLGAQRKEVNMADEKEENSSVWTILAIVVIAIVTLAIPFIFMY
jgi:hypothetical protein